MKKILKEQNISKLYIISSAVIVLLLGISFTSYFIINSYTEFQRDSKDLRQDYISSRKELARNIVERELRIFDFKRNRTEDDTKQFVKSKIYDGYYIIRNIYQANKDKKDISEIKRMIHDILYGIRWNQNKGYYFVLNTQAVPQVHPLNPQHEGRSQKNLKDMRGKYFIQEFINIAVKQGEGYSTYYWNKPGEDLGNEFIKYTFIKYFEPFDWIIGTGEYYDDIEDNIKKELLEELNNPNIYKKDANNLFVYELKQEENSSQSARIIAYPEAPNLVGTYLAEDNKDITNNTTSTDFMSQINETGEAFVESWHKQPFSDKQQLKLTYLKLYPKWNWIVGSSFFIDDIEKILIDKRAALKDQTYERIKFALIIIAGFISISLLISFYFSKGIGRILNRYRNSVENRKQMLIDSNEKLRNEIINTEEAKVALRISEEKFRAITENTTDITMIIDDNNKIKYATPTTKRILGLSPEEIFAEDLSLLVEKNEISHLLEKIATAERNPGKTYNISELCCLGKNQQAVYFEGRITALPHLPGVEGIVINLRNVTLRKKTESALYFSEEKFSKSFQLNPLIMFLSTLPDWKFVNINDAFLNILGYSQSNVIGRFEPELGLFQSQEARSNIEALLRENGQLKGFELKIRKSSGEYRDVIMDASIITIDNDKYVLTLLNDITDRINSENALRKSEEHFREVVRKMPLPIIILNSDMSFEYVNESFTRTFGYTLIETPDIHQWRLRAYPDRPYREQVIKDYERSINSSNASHSPILSAEKEIRCKNNSIKYCIIRYTIIGNRQLFIMTDITKRREAELALRNALDKLKGSNQELHHTRDALEKKVLALTQPLGDVSDIGFEDLFDLEQIQQIQDAFSVATGVASIITKTDGTPITKPSNFTDLCNMVRATEKGAKCCKRSDTLLGKINFEEPKIQRCLSASLLDSGAGITIGGRHIANWLIGQVLDDDNNIEEMVKFADEIGLSREEYRKALLKAHQMPRSQFMAISKALYLITKQMSLLAIQNVQQARHITFRNQAEIKIRESEEKFRMISEQAQMAILIIKKGKVLYANEAFSNITGYDISTIINWIPQEMLNMVHPDFRKEMNRFTFENPEKEKSFRLTVSIFTKKGAQKWLDMLSSSIIYEDSDAYLLTMLDITDRKLAEEALAHEKEILSTTMRSIGDGVITTGIENQVILMNKVAESVTGWKQEEAVGKNIKEVFCASDSSGKTELLDTLKEVMSGGEIIYSDGDCKLTARNNKEFFINNSIAPVKDNTGKIIGAVVVFRDVTEHKRLEKELQKTRKLESVGILAGGIAHDFNNILMGILGNISLAKMHTAEQTEAYNLLIQAENASHRAKSLTEQLLTFAKGGEPIKETASIPDIVKDSTDFILRGSNISCQFDFEDNLFAADIDKGQISQVIQNLILNSKQAMPDGGKIEISGQNTEVGDQDTIPLKPGNYILISIKDSGSGISEENLPLIFDPYFTTRTGGSGLGLSIAYSIINKHDGLLFVESEIDNYTKFQIYLPASSREIESKKPEAIQIKKGTGKIMVMDDEAIVREVAQNMLEFLGYGADFAKDGNEALTMYQNALDDNEKYNIVIMDLTIPGGMGGKEAVVEIKKLDPNAIVIVSSGYSTNPIMAEYSKYGFDGVITKPYKLDELSVLLESFIE